jgi:hypothetical protein
VAPGTEGEEEVTPEEKAVVQAAIKAYRSRRVAAGLEVREAVSALITRCPECNAGGHVCPGDGNPIGHGDTDCGEHDDAVTDRVAEREHDIDERPMHWGNDDRTACGKFSGMVYQYTDDRRNVTCAECLERGNNQPQWVERPWVDVRAGDTVRPPGQEEHRTTIASAVHLPRHVHPATETSRYPAPAEWKQIIVRMQPLADFGPIAETKRLEVNNPSASVEILLSPSELAAIEALGGFANRLGLVASAPRHQHVWQAGKCVADDCPGTAMYCLDGTCGRTAHGEHVPHPLVPLDDGHHWNDVECDQRPTCRIAAHHSIDGGDTAHTSGGVR